MEIGSIFEINPNWIREADKQNLSLCLKEVEKYDKKNTFFTASGREAISLALKSIEKNNPSIQKTALLPAYMCDTVFFPFNQNGWKICFYHIGMDMCADGGELCRLIEEVKPSLFLIHAYYGVDTWKELRKVLHEYQKSGLILMEDMTQSYYLKDVDKEIDYMVGSLRKWYSIPDGGFVTTNEVLCTEVVEKDSYFVNQRVKMLTSKWDYLWKKRKLDEKNKLLETTAVKKSMDTSKRYMASEDIVFSEKDLQNQKSEYLALNHKMEEYLDETLKVTDLSDVSRDMLQNFDEEEHYRIRNANYRILYEGFQNRKSVKNVFDDLDFEAAPLYLPVYAKDREALQEYFRRYDIYVPVLWPIGKENEGILNEEEQYIFSHILAVPMDHRYGETEMRKIIRVLDEYERQYK